MIRLVSLLAALSLAAATTTALSGCSSSTESGKGALGGDGGQGGVVGGTSGGGTSGGGGGAPPSVGGGGYGGGGTSSAGGAGGTAGGGASNAGAGGTPAGGAGGSAGSSNCPVGGSGGENPNSLLGKGVMEGSGESEEQYHTAEVTRDGDPYVLITNGWGPGFDEHSISWEGTSFVVKSMAGQAGSMGQPASFPTVFCGRYSVMNVPECGLPIRRDEITTLKTGWRWAPNCNEGEYNASFDIWVGNGIQLQGYLMVWLRDPPGFQPAGMPNSSHQNVTVANVPGTWNIWDGSVNNLPIINWVRATGSESYEIEFDVMDFVRDAEMRGLNVPGTHINAVAVGFEIWEGPITDLQSQDFYVQVN
jgi:hypothetical protein